MSTALVAAFALAGCGGGDGPVRPEPVCPPACPEPVEGDWSPAAPLQAPRREMPAEVLGGRVYVTGGFGDDEVVLETVEVFDLQSRAWSAGPPMPGPRHHHAAVALNGRLYVIGGYSRLGERWTREGTLFELDPATGAWTERAPLPQTRAAMAAAAWGGKLYVFGGTTGTGGLNLTSIYDPATNTWSEGAPLPTPREHVGAAVIGNTIYVAGGRNIGFANVRALEAYDPATNTWRALAPMGTARSGHGVAAMGGRLYVFGGEDLAAGAALDHAEEYDPQTNRWRPVTALPERLTGVGAVGVGSAIHVIGGATHGGATRTTQRVFSLP